MTSTDIIIIGSGPGGYRAAGEAARLGLQVVVVECDQAGGTCLNRGCIPTKTWCHEAEMWSEMRRKGYAGDVDFSKIAARKEQVVSQLRQGVETLLSMPGITLVRGTARFTGAHSIAVGEETFTAPHIIIATGSDAKRIPVAGIDLPHVLTSTELLAIDHVPARLCIIGAGVIGMEFASIFSSLGSEVTVVEFLKECLPALDSEVAKRLRTLLSRRGVDFRMQAGVKEITPEGVVYERKGKTETVAADTVLVATGRKPRLEGLDLDAAGIAYGRGGITVDDHMETNVQGVYAIGDVNGRIMLAHAATYQGLHVVHRIAGKSDHIRLDIVPSAIFTYPEAAGVGMTEDQCKEAGVAYSCKKGQYRANGKALAMEATDGMLKLIADAEGRIIGCHAYGAHAADMVQEVSCLMTKDTTVGELADMIHIHPTLGEILSETALMF